MIDTCTSSGKYIFQKMFASPLKIHSDFQNIWKNITEKVDCPETTVEEARKSVKELTIYDILDGGRTCLVSKPAIKPIDEIPLFSIALMHTLQVLGARSCVIMTHTSYNRGRGKEEFNRILTTIESGAEIIRQYSIENNIRCICLCIAKNYELRDILKEIEQATKSGTFNAYYLFDYNEVWYSTENGSRILNTLPDINVHIRHTKFQPSGGWIPDKMSRSAFLYSQNGSIYSNWESDEIVALVAMALLAKKLNEKEMLDKVYSDYNEIKHRYVKRELHLFKKVIRIRMNAKKLFTLGSPEGLYQIYY